MTFRESRGQDSHDRRSECELVLGHVILLQTLVHLWSSSLDSLRATLDAHPDRNL